MTKALEVSQLTVNYGKTSVLWDINFSVPPARLVGVIGPNGAGKSTLFKALLGLVPRISGKVRILGESYEKVRSRVSYIPQREEVDWDFPISVLDLVLMGAYARLSWGRGPSLEEKEKALHYLDQLGLALVASRQISELSGGQQQRAFIARALMQEADVFFFDEPFAGIDLTTERDLIQLFRSLQEEGKSLFIVHHDLSSLERIFDWGLMLNMRLVASGPLEEVFNESNLQECYGKGSLLLQEALLLSKHRNKGTL